MKNRKLIIALSLLLLLLIGCKENITEPDPIIKRTLVTNDVIFFSTDRDGEAKNIFMMKNDGQIIKQITKYDWGEYVATAISPDSTQLLFYKAASGLDIDVGMEVYIYFIKQDSIVGPITQGHPGNFSPDGKRFVFSRHTFTVEGGYESVYLYDLNSNTEKKLTEDGKTSFYPQISPDGKTICYESASLITQPLFWQLHLMGIDGHYITNITEPKDFYWAGSGVFTPDGKSIVFHYNEKEWCYDICKVDINSKQISYITTTRYNGNWTYPNYWNPSIDSYSNIVYFYSKKYDESTKTYITQICSSNLDGSNFVKITNNTFWNSHPVAGMVSYYINE